MSHRASAVAIVGLACRFPGAASPDAYWRLLCSGASAVQDTPAERWSLDDLYSARPGTPGKLSSARGGFITGHDRYDPAFFGIPIAEARDMDPQQLLALQVTWHAIEDAHLRPSQLAGREVGVFVGATGNDFENIVMRQRRHISAFTPTGTNASVISARISYALDLRGPSLTINTACSSSLVAVHEACLNLQAGQCELALAGGVNLLLAPETTIAVSQAGMMAPDGACKTFDEAADGYVRAEGCGMVALKLLDKALADGDRIHAVIHGTAVNQDGMTNGLTAPNRQSQEALIRRALANAGMQAEQIGHVEAHGTGTRLGDPIEINALKSTYGVGQAQDASPCYVGAVKAQIGHLEPAAGIAGLIKSVLQIRHRTIVGQTGIGTQNKLIKLAGSRLRIPRGAVPWDESIPRSAGVSAFSYGGTNCHVILSPPQGRDVEPRAQALAEPTLPEPPPASAPASPATPMLVLPLAARSPGALERLRQAHRQALSQQPGDAVPWCAAASHRLEPHALRQAYVGLGAEQLLTAMSKPLPTGATASPRHRAQAPQVGFLFAGQGSQQVGMGRGLYGRFAVFTDTLDSADAQMRAMLGTGVAALLWGEHSHRLDQTDHTQPALYVLQVALARLWQSFGVTPGVLVGHSIGEYAAAHVAGVFDFEQGLRMVIARGRLMQDHAAPGHMVAVRASREQIRPVLAALGTDVQPAAFNGPADLVLAVRPQALTSLAAMLDEHRLRYVKLKGNRAFHCAWMEPAAQRFRQTLAGETFQPPRIPLLDNLSGGSAAAPAFDADYWCRQMISPVRFHETVTDARFLKAQALVEIGAGGTLTGLASRATDTRPALAHSIAPGEPDCAGFLQGLATVYQAGAQVNWSALYPQDSGIDLPGYPFETERVFDAQKYGGQDAADAAPVSAPLPVPAPAPAAAPGRFKVTWQPLDPASLRSQPGSLLCLGSRQPMLLSVLQAAGERATCIAPLGPAPAPAPAAALAQALRHAQATPGQPAHALVFRDAFAPAPDDLNGATAWALDYLAFLRGLAAHQVTLRSITLVLDEGAHGPLHDAALLGALTSAALEFPGTHLKVARVAPDPARHAGQILSALAGADRGGEYRITGAGLLEPVLSPQAATTNTALRIHADRVYIVTGGTGSIGLHVARGLVQRGARRIVLASRGAQRNTGGITPAQLGLQGDIPQGLVLATLPCDVSRRDDVARLLDHVTQQGQRLGGIFHAAGVVAEAESGTSPPGQWADALAAKVSGTHWLSLLSEPLQPDFMLGFSSISSLWGARGLSAYSAGNRFLDEWSLAAPNSHCIRMAINWGPWRASAMVSQSTAQDMRDVGIALLEPQAAIDAMFSVIEGGAPGPVAVCTVDWPRLASLYDSIGLGGLFQQLGRPVPSGLPLPRPTPEEATVPQAGERRVAGGTDWRAQVRGALAALLDLRPQDIPTDEPLHALGVDSLRAIEFKRAIEEHTGLALAATLVFDHPTLGEIEAHLARSLSPGAGAATTAPATPATPAAAGQHHAPNPADAERDIAIIGLGCKLPGHSETPESFWQMLVDKVDPVTDSRRRWQSPLYREDAATGHTTGFGAAFVDGIEQFDARLFGVPPLEARSMDPQQRMALELAWRCLEQAGYRRSDIKGQRVGTYLGVSANEYRQLLRQAGAEREYEASGNSVNAIAGRIAFYFGLRGPAISLDTACSSSLVALHQAMAALRAGECDMALAGGVNTLLSSETFAALAQAKMLSPDWRCASFDAQANGYVRGEGGAMFLLKPLALALRDGDPVLAVLKGSAVNQDGRSASLTAPHGPAQIDVMERALADARLAPGDVDWIEAHGTGTPLGDPIELRAIDQVYGQPARPLIVGAVKSNVGHLEAASGAAGLLKIVLALRHQAIPPNLHYRRINPHIDTGAAALRCGALLVPTRTLPWPAPAHGGPRRAAVSSFGFSGTNAHLVVEEAPPLAQDDRGGAMAGDTAAAEPHSSAWTLPLAANSPASFDAMLHACRAVAQTGELRALCRGAQWQCEPMRYRAVLVAASADELRALLARPVPPADMRQAPLPDAAPAGIDPQQATPGTRAWLEAQARLFMQGADIDWRQATGVSRHARPTGFFYPMDRTAFWPPTRPARAMPAGVGSADNFAALLQAQTRAMHDQLALLETHLS